MTYFEVFTYMCRRWDLNPTDSVHLSYFLTTKLLENILKDFQVPPESFAFFQVPEVGLEPTPLYGTRF